MSRSAPVRPSGHVPAVLPSRNCPERREALGQNHTLRHKNRTATIATAEWLRRPHNDDSEQRQHKGCSLAQPDACKRGRKGVLASRGLDPKALTEQVTGTVTPPRITSLVKGLPLPGASPVHCLGVDVKAPLN